MTVCFTRHLKLTKHISRARYLRLPTAAPRQGVTRVAPITRFPPSRTVFPSRATRPESTDGSTAADEPTRPPLRSGLLAHRTGLPALLVPKARSETSPTRLESRYLASARTREPSPTRSKYSFDGDNRKGNQASPLLKSRPLTSGGDAGRSKLWYELRKVQRKPQPPSERSRSREPP